MATSAQPPSGLFVKDRPARLASDEAAAPAKVVIVHGAMDRSASFGRVIRHLDALHVVAYDRRGYGKSIDVGIGSLDDHVADLLSVIGSEPVTVFGHSIGGVIALTAAARRPDLVRSVLAFEAPMPWTEWWPTSSRPTPDDPADEAEAFMRDAIGDHYWQRLGQRTRDARRAEGGALRADIASIRGPAPFDPADVTVPVISAAGAETTWWHSRATRQLAEEVPDGEYSLVSGATHGAHLTHPTAVAGLVVRAVRR